MICFCHSAAQWLLGTPVAFNQGPGGFASGPAAEEWGRPGDSGQCPRALRALQLQVRSVRVTGSSTVTAARGRAGNFNERGPPSWALSRGPGPQAGFRPFHGARRGKMHAGLPSGALLRFQVWDDNRFYSLCRFSSFVRKLLTKTRIL
jgi:hypothetical protein